MRLNKEMKILKEKTSQEILAMKKEERMATLQNERDWFRREALGKFIAFWIIRILRLIKTIIELDKM